MEHIVTFSGGKDSQATCIWADNNLTTEWEMVFCDTAWESPVTYNFILDFEQKINKKSIRLKSEKYKGFIDLTKNKKRFSSTRNKFCTTELKVIPMVDFILDKVQGNCTIYQGIRWEESKNRAGMNRIDCYFKNYYEPIIKIDKKTGKKKEIYHKYRKKEVLSFLEKYEATVKRPIINWTGSETIKYILDNNYQYNPLYDLGFSRVGCFPCIQCTHQEVVLLLENYPKRLDIIRKYEKELGTTFFPPGYIPSRYCTKKVIKKKTGEEVMVPTIDDVIKYVKDRRMKQMPMFESSCKNIYIPCE